MFGAIAIYRYRKRKAAGEEAAIVRTKAGVTTLLAGLAAAVVGAIYGGKKMMPRQQELVRGSVASRLGGMAGGLVGATVTMGLQALKFGAMLWVGLALTRAALLRILVTAVDPNLLTAPAKVEAAVAA